MKFKRYLNPSAYWRRIVNCVIRCRLILSQPIRVVTHIDNYNVVFFVRSLLEYHLRARESYNREKVTMYWLRSVVGMDDVVYDIGANVGAYSLYAGKKVAQHSGKVYAFEPAYFNFSALCRNIIANDLGDIVIAYPVAFGDGCTPSNFFLSSTVEGSALHGLSKPVSEGGSFEPQFQQGVFVTSLDYFVSHKMIDFPNHIKIDVDGSEQQILSGMKSVLIDKRLQSIMIEINSDISGGEIESTIVSSGLEEVMVEQWQSRNTFNKLFVRSQ